MEQEFNRLLEEVKQEFPDYTVTMGLCRYSVNDGGQWWVELKGDAVICDCCGTAKGPGDVAVYCQPTFADALSAIRDKVAHKKAA
jgi:hypothetical protein